MKSDSDAARQEAEAFSLLSLFFPQLDLEEALADSTGKKRRKEIRESFKGKEREQLLEELASWKERPPGKSDAAFLSAFSTVDELRPRVAAVAKAMGQKPSEEKGGAGDRAVAVPPALREWIEKSLLELQEGDG